MLGNYSVYVILQVPLTLHYTQPPLSRPPHPHQFHSKQETSTHRKSAGREYLSPFVPSTAINDDSTNGRPGQHREAYNSENHAHPHANLLQIRREERQGRREQTLDARCEDAVYTRPCV